MNASEKFIEKDNENLKHARPHHLNKINEEKNGYRTIGIKTIIFKYSKQQQPVTRVMSRQISMMT